jgi:chromosome segregation ATPase
MSVSAALGKLTASWRPVESAAAELQRECESIEHLVQELFNEIEGLRAELERKADEVEEGRRRLAERGKQLAEQRKESGRLSHQMEQQEAHLSEALTELRELRNQLIRQQAEFEQREGKQAQALQERLQQAETERDQLRQQLIVLQASSAAGESGESVAPLLSELGEMRRQLIETRSELNAAIERSAAARPEQVPAQVVVAADGNVDLTNLQRERIELESELELVRSRASDLQETVARQKRELAEQRDDLSTELKLLRELIEQQSDLLAAHERPAPRQTPAPAPVRQTIPAAASDGDAAPADPVVSSVMAQFARLQKDVAQRRQQKKK